MGFESGEPVSVVCLRVSASFVLRSRLVVGEEKGEVFCFDGIGDGLSLVFSGLFQVRQVTERCLVYRCLKFGLNSFTLIDFQEAEFRVKSR